MAIMQSCCCWRSVRRGSFACAIYVGIYFIVLALTTGKVLQGESQYLRGNRSLPESSSFLESDTISPTTVWFNVMLFICSCCGVICNILLLYGLYKDQRVFLVPWIIVVITTCFVDVAHSLYLFIVASTFDPTKVMLYTLNFFLFCLNVPAVRYAVQPPTTTATSCLSSRRAATNNETKATATPTQSPTTAQNTLSLDKSPVTGRSSRKHVQFPDTTSDNRKGKSEVPITVLVLKMEPENEYTTSSSSLKFEETMTIDQVLRSQKTSNSQDT
ncbi:uncharacterized protein LOC102671120 isoform X3 [Apis dorsata]|uniref:uncharacterized protein LOC102671120 isoform X3 n=1 Tax=Apis dorsata TaxID=7462 RepID=UPI0003DF8046|nr:uncharacterized protein LOC102671120 isoform X3 [Apis dorsata]